MELDRTPPKKSVTANLNKRNKPDSSAEKDNSVSVKNKDRKLSNSESTNNLSVVKLPLKPTKLQLDEGKNENNSSKSNNNPAKPDYVSGINSKEYKEKYCGKCNVAFDNDKSIKCSCCTRYFHSDCLDLTKDEVAAFIVLQEKAHFYCDSCEIGAKELYLQSLAISTRVETIDKEICTIKNNQNSMKTDISILQTTTDKNCDDIDVLLEDVGQLQTSKESHRNDIERIERDTKKIIADHSNTASSVANLKSRLNKHQEAIDELESIKTDIKSNKGEVEKLKTSLLETIRSEMKQEVENKVKEQNLISFPVLPATDGAMETNQDQPTVNQQYFRELVNSQVAEMEDIKKRKFQLIIQNLKEANSPDEDRQQTKELLDLLKIDEEIHIVELIRMGKIKTDRPRLIRVTFQDLAIKRKILAKATTLRNIPEESKFANVYIKPNLTAQQLQESKNLQEELRVRRLEEPNKRFKIQRGKIVQVTPTDQ